MNQSHGEARGLGHTRSGVVSKVRVNVDGIDDIRPLGGGEIVFMTRREATYVVAITSNSPAVSEGPSNW